MPLNRLQRRAHLVELAHFLFAEFADEPAAIRQLDDQAVPFHPVQGFADGRRADVELFRNRVRAQLRAETRSGRGRCRSTARGRRARRGASLTAVRGFELPQRRRGLAPPDVDGFGIGVELSGRWPDRYAPWPESVTPPKGMCAWLAVP